MVKVIFGLKVKDTLLKKITNMKKKYNVWHIDAYSGWSDYDGPEDCNIHKNIVMDTQFTKKEVVEMYRALLGGRSTIIAKCELVKSGEIEI